MMIGRSQCAAMSLTMALVKAPPIVEVPIMIVGRTLRTTSANRIPRVEPSTRFHWSTSARDRA